MRVLENLVSSAGIADMMYVTSDCRLDVECTAHDSIGSVGRAWFVYENVSWFRLVQPWFDCAFV